MKSSFRSREPFAEEGYRVVGAAMEAYNELGLGLLEPVYQEALERELPAREIPFEPQRELTILYKEQGLLKKYVPDLFVFERVIVELKAVKELQPEHEAQPLNYLRITRTLVN